MTAPAVEIQVRAETKEAQSAISSLGQDIMGKLVPTLDVLGAAKMAWDAFSGAVRTAVGFMAESTAAAMEVERIERRAIATIQARGKFTDESFRSLKKFNDELETKYGLDADETLALQSQLAALGVMPSKLQDATKATYGLHEATGKDLNRSARMVAEAIAKGDTSLVAAFAAVEANAGTLDTKLKILDVTWGNFKEELGGTVSSSRTAAQGIDILTQSLRELIGWFQSKEAKKAADDFFKGIAEFAADTIDAVIGAVKALNDFKGSTNGQIAKYVGELFDPETWATENGMSMALENLKRAWKGELDGITTELSEPLKGAENISDRLRALANREDDNRVSFSQDPFAGTKTFKPKDDEERKKARAQAIRAEMDGIREQRKAEDDIAKELAAERDRRDKQETEQQLADLDRWESAYKQKQRIQKYYDDKMEAEEKRFNSAWNNLAIQGVGGFASAIGQQLGEGTLTIESFAGTFIQTIGQMLIQLGSMALAAGILGSAVPFLWGITGGPAAIAAGTAAIVTGSAIVALGASMGGKNHAATATQSHAGSPSYGRSGSRLGADNGFESSGGSGGATTNVYNISFARGFVTGTPREVARSLRDTLAAGLSVSAEKRLLAGA